MRRTPLATCLALALLLLGVTAQAQDAYGPGAAGDETTRTVTATNSPDVTALGTIAGSVGALDDTVATPGAAIPAKGLQVTGTDGANARALLTDATGALQVEDAATGATSAAVPASAQLMGAADSVSGLLMPLRVYDADTGAGNDYRQGVVPILPGAGGGTPASAGAGAVDAGTQRVTLPTDDPAVTSLGLLDDTVRAAGDGSGKGLQLMVYDTATTNLQTPKMYDQALNVNLTSISGAAVQRGIADVTGGTLAVIEAAVATGASTHIDVTAAEVAVLAANPGRKYLRIQVYADTDGAVCCALGATTTACAIGEILDPSPAAGQGGGSLDFEGYSGAVTCRAAGAWTTTVAATEY